MGVQFLIYCPHNIYNIESTPLCNSMFTSADVYSPNSKSEVFFLTLHLCWHIVYYRNQ